MRPSLYEQLALDRKRAHQEVLEAERRDRELARIRHELAGLELDLQGLKLRRALERRYDPNQPRMPAGQPGGGQWTVGDGGGEAGESERARPESIITRARRLALATRPDGYQRCLDLCYPLLERPQPPWSDRNKWDFHRCMDECLRNPPR